MKGLMKIQILDMSIGNLLRFLSFIVENILTISQLRHVQKFVQKLIHEGFESKEAYLYFYSLSDSLHTYQSHTTLGKYSFYSPALFKQHIALGYHCLALARECASSSYAKNKPKVSSERPQSDPKTSQSYLHTRKAIPRFSHNDLKVSPK